MLIDIWNAVLYKPLFNLLAFLVDVLPGGDLGLAIVVLTILVKFVLFPLSQRSILSQARMNLLSPELKKIKDSGASKEEQARLTFDLYKKNKTNPFSGCLLILIQFPIIIALYLVFYKGFKNGINFDPALPYSFVPVPETVNPIFLGIVDVMQKSIPLALAAGISQYFQARLMPKPPSVAEKGSFQDSFTKSMNLQMKYVFPIVAVFVSYSISGAVALYWTVSNIFAICQQLYLNKKIPKGGTVIIS